MASGTLRPGSREACVKLLSYLCRPLPRCARLPAQPPRASRVPVPAAGVDAELVDAPVLDLLKEGERAQLLHDVQAAGAVVVQDVAECLRAAVEEVLVVHGVGIVAELQGAGHGGQGPGAAARGHHHRQLAKARVREAGQRLLREHEAAAAHVDREAVPERQGLPFTLAAENAGVQRGQGAAVQRRVRRRPPSGRQLHPRRRCVRAPQSWGARRKPGSGEGGGTAPGGSRDFPDSRGGCLPPAHPSTLHPLCSFRLWPLGRGECAIAALGGLGAGAEGSRQGWGEAQTRSRRGQSRGTLPGAEALPGLTPPAPPPRPDPY